MPGIDPSRTFQPLRIAVLTVSDTRTFETDTSGAILVERATGAGHSLAARRIIPDIRDAIERQLLTWAEDDAIDVILTTGGTGLTERDITPEAVEAVCDKMIPGFGEVFRAISMGHIGLSTIQSRATAGICRGTPVFALPGSNGACRDAWDEVLVHQLDLRYRPCNLAELVPRLIRDPSPRPEAIGAEDVVALRDSLGRALSEGDAAALFACFVPGDATLFLGPQGDGARGDADVREALAALDLPVSNARLQPIADAHVESGGLVARDAGRILAGETPMFGYSLVARRVLGEARCVSLHLAALTND